MTEFEISIRATDEKSLRLFNEHAKALITFSSDGDRMSVSSITVNSLMRRQGIARSMLQKAKDIALERRVARITAAITSRESLDVFSRVFGEESIEVEQVGLYEEEITDKSGMEQYTTAKLEFRLSSEAEPIAEPQLQ